jgi:hypothetical protein
MILRGPGAPARETPSEFRTAKLACPACGASRELADDPACPDAFIPCDACRVPIEIPRDDFLGDGDPLSFASSPDDGWYVEVRSGVYGPATRARMERWIREGRVDWEDLLPTAVVLASRPGAALIVEHLPRQEATAPEREEDAPPAKVRRRSRGRRYALGLRSSRRDFFRHPHANLPVIGSGVASLRRGRAALAILSLRCRDPGRARGRPALSATLGWSAGRRAIGYLLQRRVRGCFQPGGGARASLALVLSGVAGVGLITAATRVISRAVESRLVPGNGYAYTITRPHRAWRDLPAARAEAGSAGPDLELMREGAGAVIGEAEGRRQGCSERAVARIRRAGSEPTVYGARDVYAAALPGAQAIVSVRRGGARVATLVTCFADGGLQYRILGSAEEKTFERLRPELYRMATSFRLDEVDDPMHLDIHTGRGPESVGPAPPPGSLAGVIASADQAVVTIASVIEGNERGYGSGTLVRDDGVVVTNHHVVRDALRVTVAIPGHGARRARVVAVDPDRDLALLKVPGRDLPFLPLARRPVSTGDDVIAIGSPMGLSHTVTKGIISSTRRVREGVDYLQTDVSVNPGNSGGPLINASGEVVGINTFILRESEAVALTGLNFAVSVPYVRELAEAHGFPLPILPSRPPRRPAGAFAGGSRPARYVRRVRIARRRSPRRLRGPLAAVSAR